MESKTEPIKKELTLISLNKQIKEIKKELELIKDNYFDGTDDKKIKAEKLKYIQLINSLYFSNNNLKEFYNIQFKFEDETLDFVSKYKVIEDYIQCQSATGDRLYSLTSLNAIKVFNLKSEFEESKKDEDIDFIDFED